MTPTLTELLALLDKATPGEWEVVPGDDWTTDIGTPEGEYEDGRKRHWNVASVNRRRDEWEANRALIAAAVNYLRAHRERLLKAEAMEWQPVETAPKDGTRILASDPEWNAGVVVVARWWDGAFHVGDLPGDEIYPRHWMPLPPPPGTGVGS